MPSLQTTYTNRRELRRCAFGAVAGAVLLASGLLLGGCNLPREGRGVAGGAAAEAGPEFPHAAWQKVGYRLNWRGYPFAGTRGAPRVTELRAWSDYVIAQERSSEVSLMESTTGAVRWSTDLANPLTRFVGVTRDARDPNLVLVASESELFGLTAQTGNLLNRERFEKVVNTRPLVAGPLAIFGTSTGEVQAHLIGRSVKAWGFGTSGAIDAAPVRVGAAIGFVSQAGDVLFLSEGGAVIGRSRIYSGLANDPVANDSTMFIAGLDQSLWAIDPSGSLRWRVRHSAPLRAQPATDGPRVYCDLPGQGLTGFDAATGRQLWVAKNTGGTVVGTQGASLIVWDGEAVSLVDAVRGDVLERAEIPGVAFIRTDSFADGNLYAVGIDGTVSKLTAIR